MDYITVTGTILKLGTLENNNSSVSYSFIELQENNKTETMSTNRVLVSENINLLLTEEMTGEFVFAKSKKISTLVGFKMGDQQATILEDVSMENIKGMKALKAMSAIGLLGAALGLTQLFTEGWTVSAFLLTVFGTLFTVITGVQPMILERVKGKHFDALQAAGFDLSLVIEQREKNAEK
ncbi:hypothetical protein GCM10007916_35290 [Psychromonas marina]|uniref:Uncharacterized protein n=1 Tax=Psychromonas marina TaxID=88364 RepID=A0ABQ6E4Z5_9GAMM|nr:hypothetical protein [Psychromonas marina]GLS92457.1 hypothetical protein GCM10007916_35290 [Psychromonas marina]